MEKYFKDTDFSNIQNHIVLIDIDGTLVSDGEENLDKEILTKLKELENQGNTIYFCSNKNIPGRKNEFTKLTSIPFTSSKFRKPNKKIATLVENKEKKPLTVVGDKILVDGVFAKGIGAKFIKVKRLIVSRDSVINRVVYALDDIAYVVYRLFKRLI